MNSVIVNSGNGLYLLGAKQLPELIMTYYKFDRWQLVSVNCEYSIQV